MKAMKMKQLILPKEFAKFNATKIKFNNAKVSYSYPYSATTAIAASDNL